jgi:hypothetical protein
LSLELRGPTFAPVQFTWKNLEPRITSELEKQ